MKNTFTPPAFTLFDLPAAHADKRFVMVNINHQFISQQSARGINLSAFDNYNSHYEISLKMLRALNVPMIHIVSDPMKHVNAQQYNDDEYGQLLSKIKPFYQNNKTFAVREAIGDPHPNETKIEIDMLHAVENDDIVFTDIPNNKSLFEKILKENSWDVIGIGGQYKEDIILQAMQALTDDYTILGFGDLIEGKKPTAPTAELRILEMTKYFKQQAPEIVMTHTMEINHVLGSFHPRVR